MKRIRSDADDDDDDEVYLLRHENKRLRHDLTSALDHIHALEALIPFPPPVEGQWTNHLLPEVFAMIAAHLDMPTMFTVVARVCTHWHALAVDAIRVIDASPYKRNVESWSISSMLCCSRLVELNVRGCFGVTNDVAAEMALALPLLRALDITHTRVDMFSTLAPLAQLARLWIGGTDGITDARLETIPSRVTDLTLSWCPGIHDRNLATLGHLTQLRSLYLKDCDNIGRDQRHYGVPVVYPAAWRTTLQQFTAHQMLRFELPNFYGFAAFTILHDVTLSHTHVFIGDNGLDVNGELAETASFPALTRLAIVDAPGLSTAWFVYLTRIARNLRHFELRKRHHRDFSFLQHFAHLESAVLRVQPGGMIGVSRKTLVQPSFKQLVLINGGNLTRRNTRHITGLLLRNVDVTIHNVNAALVLPPSDKLHFVGKPTAVRVRRAREMPANMDVVMQLLANADQGDNDDGNDADADDNNNNNADDLDAQVRAVHEWLHEDHDDDEEEEEVDEH